MQVTAVPQGGIGTSASRDTSPAFDQNTRDGWRRRLRQQVKACLQSDWLRPLSRGLASIYRGQATSLLYHRILPGPAVELPDGDASFSPNRLLGVAASRFDEQMRELQRRGGCVDLPQAVAALKAGALRPGTVTVTFDDGYRDNLAVALPILERHGIPATIFVTTGLVDRSAVLWWDELEALVRGSPRLVFDWHGRAHEFVLDGPASQWHAFNTIGDLFRPLAPPAQAQLLERLRAASDVRFSYEDEILDWDELRALDRHPLVTIAAHTINHPVLAQVDGALAAREIDGSRRRLEQQLGHPVPYFAYPFGGPDEAGPREIAICAEQGFEFALTTRSGHWHAGHRAHPCALPRIMIEYDDTLDDFRFKLSGLEALLRQKGRRFVTT